MLIKIKIIIKSDTKLSAARGDTGGEWSKLWWDVITCGVWAYDNNILQQVAHLKEWNIACWVYKQALLQLKHDRCLYCMETSWCVWA